MTNDLAQDDTSVAQQVCHGRWKIEQFHREVKQVTGLEKYNVDCHALCVTSSDVPPSFGYDWHRSPIKQDNLCIKSNMAYWRTISGNNSKHPLFT